MCHYHRTYQCKEKQNVSLVHFISVQKTTKIIISQQLVCVRNNEIYLYSLSHKSKELQNMSHLPTISLQGANKTVINPIVSVQGTTKF